MKKHLGNPLLPLVFALGAIVIVLIIDSPPDGLAQWRKLGLIALLTGFLYWVFAAILASFHDD